jgi:ubiquinone/menaquinone biosynthesis C-methylase UbiE
MLNDWNEREVKRAETTWGDSSHQYSKDMFNFTICSGQSYLDLGCGFGRFLQFLNNNKDEPNYIGYDSSGSMIERIRERFPEYTISTFLRNITDPINHPQESIILSAILIHLTTEDQQKILTNILALRPLPKAITFDINSPCEVEIDRLKNKQTDHFERVIKTTKDGSSTFRMTWQSHYEMTRNILKGFKSYNLTTKFYDLANNRHKVVYMLELKT